MFGEGLEEHLLATNRTIAFPIGKKYAFKIASISERCDN